MFIFVVQTLQNKWNEIYMKQLAGGKHMENDCFPRTFEMKYKPHRKLVVMYESMQLLSTYFTI
jgi:hypothetical protein